MSHQEIERQRFLYYIKDFIEKDPEAAAHVADYVQAGLRAALDETRERAADMEIVAATLAAKRYKGSEHLVFDKLTKWQGKTSLRWDWLLNKMVKS